MTTVERVMAEEGCDDRGGGAMTEKGGDDIISEGRWNGRGC